MNRSSLRDPCQSYGNFGNIIKIAYNVHNESIIHSAEDIAR